MNILITISDSYTPYAGAMLQSMADNNHDLPLDIYVVAPDITDENRDKLSRQFAQNKNFNIIFPFISDTVRKEIDSMEKYLPKPFNTSFLLRLYSYRILPKDIQYILFLDVDIIITSSLKELTNIQLDKNTALAAVKDLVRYDDYERLGIDREKHTYFNAGVMLINLDYWREHNIGNKCLNLLIAHSTLYKFLDQDALNVACEGHVTYLHPKFNCITSFFARREFLKARVREEEFENVQDATKSPVIIHYTFPYKPWHKGGFVPKRELWEKALAKTEWSKISIPYKGGIKGMIRHYMKTVASYTLPLIGMHLQSDIYHRRRYKHLYWLSMIVYYCFAQYLPNFDSRFFGKLSNKIRVLCVKNIFDYVGKGVNIGRKARFGNGRGIYIDSRSNIGAN